jgi:hypothetical protein
VGWLGACDRLAKIHRLAVQIDSGDIDKHLHANALSTDASHVGDTASLNRNSDAPTRSEQTTDEGARSGIATRINPDDETGLRCQ